MALTPEAPKRPNRNERGDPTQPHLLDENGGVGDEWVAWYKNQYGCSTATAVLEGVRQHRQLMEKMKKFQQLSHTGLPFV